jgi:hypothetical protein
MDHSSYNHIRKMMNYKIGVVCVALLTGLAAMTAEGQPVRPRVGGLEQDSLYTALLLRETALNVSQDSLSSRMQQMRAAFGTLDAQDTPGRAAMAEQLLGMENELFALRNRLGSVAARINAIEQEFIIRSLTRPAANTTAAASAESETPPPAGSADLLRSDWFRQNLTGEEYAQLQRSAGRSAEREELIADFKEQCARLERSAEAYQAAPTPSAADSIGRLFREATTRIEAGRRQFEAIWSEPYRQEQYLYAYLLDKLNRTAELQALNEQARIRPAFDPEEVVSAAFAEYPAQAALLIDYQLALAQALNLHSAVDSLTRAKRRSGNEDLAFPKIVLTEKEFVHYEDVSLHDPPLYNAGNPIPKLEIPDEGTYYSVVVGTFSTRQAVSIFRGAAPVGYRQTGSQWRYFVGLFRSYGEAQQAVRQLSDAGFRRPEPVRWRDGTYENLAAEAARSAGWYRIGIVAPDGELSGEVRSRLDRYAVGKEITRVGDTYFVGTFTDRIQTDEVLAVLEALGLAPTLETVEE